MKRVAAAVRRRDLVRFGFGMFVSLINGAGRRIVRGSMSEGIGSRPSTLGLIGDAISQTSKLISSEIVLAKTELSENIKAAIAAVVGIIAAAVLLIVAQIFLLQALVAWLIDIGWRPAMASLLVGAGVGIIALAAIFIAKSRLSAASLAPSKTIEQAAKTLDVVTGKTDYAQR